MNVLYVRVSSLDQATQRQRITEKNFGLVVEDKCSGTVSFFEREGGKEIKTLVDNGILKCLSVWQIDRVGRNLRDILNTIHYFTERKISIHFISQNLKTLDENGQQDPISTLIISTLGIVGQMQREQIRENQLQGIRLAKLKGIYKGRKPGSQEDTLRFLSKETNRKALEHLKKGYKATEISKILGTNINTITKIKKLGLNPAA